VDIERSLRESTLLAGTVALVGFAVVLIGTATTAPSDLYFTPAGTLIISAAFRVPIALASGVGGLLPYHLVREPRRASAMRYAIRRSVIPGLVLAALLETGVAVWPFGQVADLIGLTSWWWLLLYVCVISGALVAAYLSTLRAAW
jgi:hypothetical protein